MSEKALLIIDMQRGDFPPVKFKYQAERTIEKINLVAARFRAEASPVIYIQHDGSAEKAFIPGSHDWEILPELTQAPEDKVVSKTANNAFYRSELDALLRQLGIKELFISGSATDFCVNATVQAALALDYQVTVIADAHTTGNQRPKLDASDLIEHYNWVWANMTPTRGTVRVLTSEELGF
ncbi:MAG: cysteine hydrolase family protein [Roseivirga sp.]